MIVAPIKWMQQDAWCDLCGWKVSTIAAWRESGELIEGTHWIYSRRRILLNPQAMDEFLEQNARYVA